MEKVIGRGAEAVLYMEDGNLVKERIEKGYRIKELDDRLRRRRTRLESKILSRCPLHRCSGSGPWFIGTFHMREIIQLFHTDLIPIIYKWYPWYDDGKCKYHLQILLGAVDV